MVTQKVIKIFHSVQEIGLFSFIFRIWTSATPRPIPNDILQSLGLHLVNINAYAKFYQNIPNSLRVINICPHFSRTGRRHFHFFRIWASATPWPIPNDICQSLGLHLVNINAYANGLRVINIFRHFSQTGRRQNLHKLSGDKIKCLIIRHTKKVNFQLTFRVVQFITQLLDREDFASPSANELLTESKTIVQ